jgi:hypothetical protein
LGHKPSRLLTGQQRSVQEIRVLSWTSGPWAKWAEPTGPLSANKPGSADVMLTSATFLFKNPFLIQKVISKMI